MATLGKVLFAAAFDIRVADVPMEKIIVSTNPLVLRAAKAKKAKDDRANAALDLL